ncbi:uncharacterized protein J4E84_006247 [Alternaria hordeiaustralica]|uniref:uncharacterized protein n=1 Tax=Alternaria hordeiaustralica TaxID=1187925 RepID=UPI0020C24676|nr:uncharacterized protein J4E84_006247 [Alternaria hordeiaustralica]KAI4685519.1 hypothetical protein J4E84_006247 [Alternaria hordeiaustralica]
MDRFKGPPTLIANASCLEIAQRNQRQSPLLRLPAEIRNKIFDLAQELSARSWKHDSHFYWDRLELSRASRQIFAETAHAYFAIHIYPVARFIHREFDLSDLSKLRKRCTPLQLRLIRHIDIDWDAFQSEDPAMGLREPIEQNMRTLRIFPALETLIISEAPYQVTGADDWYTKEFRKQVGNQDLEVVYLEKEYRNGG